ncbi:arylesterase [Cellvibrio mixtus]|uniref:Arylesterase n=1 Tax=Cellvibrio mixtus TaxID=39650 RepID=A0A266Q4D8_9GAMM|nr:MULTISPECIES: arylesterase [Cellvibrio]AQT59176.1 arylesterase [Cellvibrio sp. PSBB023]OZY84733.1 arylesterase [Cellvibrio mixtus]
MNKLKIYLFLLLTIVISHAYAQPKTTILVMGDSLSAGYGIDIEKSWVSLLEKELTKQKDIQIINASVSGETSSGGNTRLPALLNEHQPHVVILELGGNDALRGQPLKLLEKNLQSMIDASKKYNAKVLLTGMQIPPNYGARYSNQFKELYPKLATKNDIALVPFLLEGIGGNAELMQRDGIHPTAEAQPIIVNNVLPELLSVLESI